MAVLKASSWLKIGVLVVAMLAAIGVWELYKGVTSATGQSQLMDHFTCDVIAEGQSVHTRVSTFNEFGTQTVRVLSPHLLCVPTAIRQHPA